MVELTFRFYAELNDFLPAEASRQYHEIRLCQSCQRIYWKGSHYQRLEQFITSIRQQENDHG